MVGGGLGLIGGVIGGIIGATQGKEGAAGGASLGAKIGFEVGKNAILLAADLPFLITRATAGTVLGSIGCGFALLGGTQVKMMFKSKWHNF